MSDAGAVTAAGSPGPKKNGYYYWHGHGHERKEVGDVAPMPVHVPLAKEGTAAASVSEPTEVAAEINKYSWCNNSKTVSVYIDVEGAAAENTTVDFRKNELSVRVQDGVNSYKFLRLPLSKSIKPEESSFRFKLNQVVIKLQKDGEVTWFDLVGSPKGDDDKDV